MACPVIDPSTGTSLEYRHLMRGPDKIIWERAFANDLGRLAQGIGKRMPSGNNTIFFTHPCDIPLHKKVTYGRLVVDIRLLKEEKIRVRLTVGGDKLDFLVTPPLSLPPSTPSKFFLIVLCPPLGHISPQQISRIFSTEPSCRMKNI